MPEPSGPMTAPSFEDDDSKLFLVTSAQLRRVEITMNRLFAERRLEGDGYRDLAQFLQPALEDPYEFDLNKTLEKAQALDEIHRMLSGKEWSSDELEDIAQVLVRVGYDITDPNDILEDDDGGEA